MDDRMLCEISICYCWHSSVGCLQLSSPRLRWSTDQNTRPITDDQSSMSAVESSSLAMTTRITPSTTRRYRRRSPWRHRRYNFRSNIYRSTNVILVGLYIVFADCIICADHANTLEYVVEQKKKKTRKNRKKNKCNVSKKLSYCLAVASISVTNS